jgi:plasmid stabilization system protein ParE
VTKRLIWLPEAETELLVAAAWYHASGADSNRFVTHAYAAANQIPRHPQSFSLAEGGRRVGARQVPIKRFSYRLIFIELAGELRIIAVMHKSQRPGYWLDRV